MGFGNGYEQSEYDVTVPEGDYFVQLGIARDVVTPNGYAIRKIPIRIKGVPNANPKTWDWFDIPQDDVEKMARWNSDMTRNCDAFGVRRGDFNPASWTGRTGWVHIAKNTKTGYMEVKWSIIKKDGDTSEPAHTQAKPAAQPKHEEYSPSNQQQTPPDFDDQIPF